MAQLNEALAKQLARPPAISSPPGVFLSYRRGTPDGDAWVSTLRDELVHRGYPTLLDRDVPLEDVDVPVFVARICECRYFLAIVDAGYLERLATRERTRARDGSVFDEVNLANLLSKEGRLRVIGLLRSGSDLPRGFAFPQLGREGNTIDVRTPEQLRQFLDDVFPFLRTRPHPAAVAAARNSLIASEAFLAQGAYVDALQEATKATRHLPDAPDGYAQQLRAALASGDIDAGLAAATQILRLLPDSGEALLAAVELTNHAGNPEETIRLATRLRHSPAATEDERALGQYLLGDALDDVDQSYAGRAHLAVAARLHPEMAQIWNDLGYVCRRLGWLDEALDHFQEGLRLAPTDPGLLKNRIAAALEAGQADIAFAAIDNLRLHHPDDPAIRRLAQLASAVADGAQPSPLSVRIPKPSVEEWIACSDCPALVPVSSNGFLCGGCGTCLSNEQVCPHCGADGGISVSLIRAELPVLCPYCRQGSLTLRGLERGEPTGRG